MSGTLCCNRPGEIDMADFGINKKYWILVYKNLKDNKYLIELFRLSQQK